MKEAGDGGGGAFEEVERLRGRGNLIKGRSYLPNATHPHRGL